VEGGHRALLFNRLVGVKELVQTEGMHFMVPWFEYPIVYDIRPKPRMIQSLTGSKGECARGAVCERVELLTTTGGLVLLTLLSDGGLRRSRLRPTLWYGRYADGEHHDPCAVQAGCDDGLVRHHAGVEP
jgi:hypothetical protein